MKITFTVNGERRSLEAEPDMPLLWALRDLLGLKGAKYGCGVGCRRLRRVHRARQRTPDALVRGAAEIVAGRRDPHHRGTRRRAPRAAGVARGAGAAVRLLPKTPRPTDAQIRAGMEGVLCRCGTYPRIEAAVRRAAGATTGKAEG